VAHANRPVLLHHSSLQEKYEKNMSGGSELKAGQQAG